MAATEGGLIKWRMSEVSHLHLLNHAERPMTSTEMHI